VNGESIVIARTNGNLCALQNKCSHMPLPIAGGKIDGDRIVCPWHNSEFDLCTGENKDWVKGVAGVKLPGWSRRLIAFGKEPQPIKAYTVIEEGDEVFIEV